MDNIIEDTVIGDIELQEWAFNELERVSPECDQLTLENDSGIEVDWAAFVKMP